MMPRLAHYYPSLAQRYYVEGKLVLDPLYPAVYQALAEIPEPLLDVGCGMGVLAFYLRTRGWSAPILGVDVEHAKIALAQSVAPHFPPRCEFAAGDAAAALPAHSGHVTLLDVLQYVPVPERSRLLQACAARVSPNGLLVIRSGLHDHHWRMGCTRWLDRLATRIGWIRTPALAYPTETEMQSILQATGLTGTFVPLWGRMPLNNWLGVFRRGT